MAKRTCSIDGCEKSEHCRGWCGTHYARWRCSGTTDDPRPTEAERFWSHVDRRGATDCWLWTASTNPKGYGQFSIGDRANQIMRGAHRWAWEHTIGPIPPGLELDHLCRNRRCVNPAHLEPVTHKENLLRGQTISARNKAATHCPAGHPYDEANTYWDPTGGRRCRQCARMRY